MVTLLIVVTYNVGVAVVVTLMCPYYLVDPSAPLAAVFDYVGLSGMRNLISVGAPCGILGRWVACFDCLLVACLTSQQQASVSQGRIFSDKFTCCHTEVEAADPAFYLTQSQYTDTGPTSPSADPITPDAWQGSHWSANV